MDVKTKQDALYKRVLSVVLALAFCLTLMPVMSTVSRAAGEFADGDGSEETPYLIATPEQLLALAATDSLWGEHFKLTEDIDLGGEEWTPIGNSVTKFTGTFDGNGHTVGLRIDVVSNEKQGLFGYVGSGGTVKNLTLSGKITFVGTTIYTSNDKGSYTNYVGGIVGSNEGTIENCINNCDVIGSIDESVDGTFANNGSVSLSIGGIAGINSGAIKDCVNNGAITGNDDYGVVYGGGITGRNDGEITNCSNAGKIIGNGDDLRVGGISGRNYAEITNCSNAGEIIGNGNSSWIGGISGDISDGTVENCWNDATVSSDFKDVKVGGIAGAADRGTITGCYNLGTIINNGSTNTQGSCVGGILAQTNCGTVSKCYNIGNVTGDNVNQVGGIVGYAYGSSGKTSSVSYCYNYGTISGGQSLAVGAVVGKNAERLNTYPKAETEDCYYLVIEGSSLYGIGSDGNDGSTNVGATPMTAAQFASGEVAWLLNGETATPAADIVWYQNISTAPTDEFPGLAGDESTIVNKLEIPYTYTDSNGDTQTIEYANPPGDVRLPEGASVQLGDTKVTVPKGGTMSSTDSVKISEDESAKIGGTEITIPESGTLNSNDGNGVAVPEDTEVKLSDGTEVTLPNGGIIDKDGNIVTDKLGLGETVIEYPADAEVKANGDGTVTVPDGTKVTPPKGTPVTTIIGADNKATVDKDGNITFPGANGGSIKIGSADITVPSGGTMKPQSDGKVFLPKGSTATLNGGQPTNAPEGGGVYDPATGTWDGVSTDDTPGNTGAAIPPVMGDNGGQSDSTTAPSTGDNNDPTGDSADTSDGISADDINVGSADGNGLVTIGKDSVGSLKDEVIASHLTDEDKAAIKDGNKLDVLLSAEDAANSVSDTDRQAAEAVLDGTGYAAGRYLNIDLLKQINGEEVGKITELNSPITLVFIIPEELRKENRIFGIVRIHNGEAKFFEDLDNDPDTITIVTDRFSTYVIVYKDLDAPVSGNPGTGAATPIAITGLACAVIVAAVVIKKRKMI